MNYYGFQGIYIMKYQLAVQQNKINLYETAPEHIESKSKQKKVNIMILLYK